MKKIINYIRNHKLIIITFSLIFVFSLVCNYLTIWAADDYAFYNIAWTGKGSFSFITIFNQAKWFYFAWTGRFVSSFLNYFLLYFDKSIFNIVNSISITYFCVLLYKFLKADVKDSKFLPLVIFILSWIFIPAYGQVMLWQIGSVIYLWMANLVLTVSYILKTKLNSNSNISLWYAFPLFILSVLAGNGFETISIVLICFEVLSLFYHYVFLKNKVKLWHIICLSGSIIGFLLNALSPGNAVRMQSMSIEGNLFEKIYNGLGTWFYNGIIGSKLFILIPLLLIAFVIFIYQNANKSIKNKMWFNLINHLAFVFIAAIFFYIFISYKGSYNDYMISFWENTLKYNIIILGAFSLLLLWAVILFFNYKRIIVVEKQKIFMRYLIITISGLVGVASYVMTPTAWSRSYMGISIFLLITLIGIIYNIKINKKFVYLGLLIVISLFIVSSYQTLNDMKISKEWSANVDKEIRDKISSGENAIYVNTLMSTNSYNAASIEKWVIPPIIEDVTLATENGIHRDYEWINIAITNYYFKDTNAWNNGYRIIGIE